MSGAATQDAPDPFGTAALREIVLRTWAASPARFREDANAEEHLALGYGGRVLAELAANAADAAELAGGAGPGGGEIVIALHDRELRVANSGAPLDAAGVAALAALRASAKREDTAVGHFGVGFTAVRALADEVEIVSVGGGVRFSAARTARAVRDLGNPALDGELRRRDGQLPALRLPWPVPAAADLPAGCVTEVRLSLRDEVDVAAVAAQLTVDTATDLLWALPGLAAVTVAGRRVRRSADPSEPGVARITVEDVRADSVDTVAAPPARRFRIQPATGTVPPELLAGRPVEERTRDRWRLTWILPVDSTGRPDPLPRSMIGAPTPTEEPLCLPAQLVGTLPVDESRSRIAAGPLADFLIARAADAYRDLVQAIAPADRPALIPPGGFPIGDVDAAVRAAVTDRLRRTAFLAGADGTPLSPDRAGMVVGVSGAAAALIAEAMPALIDWPPSPAQVERLRSIGVTVQPLASVTAALAQIERPPAFWQQVYQGLAGSPIDQLADLPVPRRGGGTLIGPRGVLLADGDGSLTADLADRASRLLPGLRLAAAGADHPLLRRLGAEPASAATIANDPALAAEIRRRLDDLDHDDPDPADLREFAAMVLALLDAGGAGGVDAAGVLADVLLTDTDGEPWPAGSLLLPGAPLAGLLADDADLPQVGDGWVADYGADRLAALGVRAGFGVRRYLAPPGPDTDLPDVQDWAELVPQAAGETFLAVPDLDLVDAAAWPAALELLASERDTRDALHPTATGPSYTAWWVRTHAAVAGLPLGRWRAAEATELAGLYDVLPVTMPVGIAGDLGVLTTLHAAAADPPELLSRWADPDRTVAPDRVPAVTAALVAAAAADPAIELPAGVRTLAGGVVDADAAAVLDLPWLAQVLDPAALVAGGTDPGAVADVLDLPLASRRQAAVAVTGQSPVVTDLAALPAAVRCLRACDRADLAARPVTVDPDLAVRVGADTAGEQHRVGWWLDGDRLLLDGAAEGIARAVAYLAGRWPDRHRLAAIAVGGAVALAEAGLD